MRLHNHFKRRIIRVGKAQKHKHNDFHQWIVRVEKGKHNYFKQQIVR